MKAEDILKKIENLATGKGSEIQILKELDACGLILAPDEDCIQYKERLIKMFTAIKEFNKDLEENQKVNLFNSLELDKANRIPDDILKEAALINQKFYAFSIDWIPGFFMNKSLGLLWGGCAMTFPENNMSLFLIRGSFAKKRKWLFYKREELLSHELCHIARTPIEDIVYEEFFAYKLSPSAFRRYIGNCFRYGSDALFFIIPFFMLLGAQATQLFFLPALPIYPFWIVAGLYPAFLLVRNQIARKFYYKAEANLIKAGLPTAQYILFRCSKEEIQTISAFSKDILGLKEWLGKQSNTFLHWQIIYERFMAEEAIVEFFPRYEF